MNFKIFIKSFFKDLKSSRRRNRILSYKNPYKVFLSVHPLDKSSLSAADQNIWDEESLIHATKLKMYVLVRRDILPLVHCGVQAAHALAEYVNSYDNEVTKQWVECDKTLIVLEATADDIDLAMHSFEQNGLTFCSFREPDMSNVQTAVAFQPLNNEDGAKYFSHLKLLS